MNTAELEHAIAAIAAFRERYREYVGSRVIGYPELLDRLFISFLAGGNVLLEGAPGLGKTTLAKAYAEFFGLGYRRVQFTPDLMPLDIVGSNILEDTPNGGREFRFFKGPIFANVVLGDEINRATPKTQSAFLEAMEEKRITFLGVTHELPKPFFVIATQNPIELEGTYPLPEAQVDRFLMKLDFTMPDLIALRDIIKTRGMDRSGTGAQAAETATILELWERASREMIVLDEIVDYAARLTLATHPGKSESQFIKKYVMYGASPRCAVALVASAKALAASVGRVNVSYDDIESLFEPVAAHRLVLGFEAEADGVRPSDVLDEARGIARRQLEGTAR